MPYNAKKKHNSADHFESLGATHARFRKRMHTAYTLLPASYGKPSGVIIYPSYDICLRQAAGYAARESNSCRSNAWNVASRDKVMTSGSHLANHTSSLAFLQNLWARHVEQFTPIKLNVVNVFVEVVNIAIVAAVIPPNMWRLGLPLAWLPALGISQTVAHIAQHAERKPSSSTSRQAKLGHLSFGKVRLDYLRRGYASWSRKKKLRVAWSW